MFKQEKKKRKKNSDGCFNQDSFFLSVYAKTCVIIYAHLEDQLNRVVLIQKNVKIILKIRGIINT